MANAELPVPVDPLQGSGVSTVGEPPAPQVAPAKLSPPGLIPAPAEGASVLAPATAAISGWQPRKILAVAFSGAAIALAIFFNLSMGGRALRFPAQMANVGQTLAPLLAV